MPCRAPSDDDPPNDDPPQQSRIATTTTNPATLIRTFACGKGEQTGSKQTTGERASYALYQLVLKGRYRDICTTTMHLGFRLQEALCDLCCFIHKEASRLESRRTTCYWLLSHEPLICLIHESTSRHSTATL